MNSILFLFSSLALLYLVNAATYPYDWCLVPPSGSLNPLWYQCPYEKYADLVLNVDPLCVGYTKYNKPCTDLCNDLYYSQNDPYFTLAELYKRNNTGSCIV